MEMIYVIGIGWIVSMVGYGVIKKVGKKSEVYYDLTQRVIKNKKYKDRITKSGKSMFDR